MELFSPEIGAYLKKNFKKRATIWADKESRAVVEEKNDFSKVLSFQRPKKGKLKTLRGVSFWNLQEMIWQFLQVRKTV